MPADRPIAEVLAEARDFGVPGSAISSNINALADEIERQAAEIDALRAALLEASAWLPRKSGWGKRHAPVITRAMEACNG